MLHPRFARVHKNCSVRGPVEPFRVYGWVWLIASEFLKPMSAKAAGLLTLLGGGLWLVDDPPPVVRVNKNNDLFAAWPSESMTGTVLEPECAFYNQSVVFSSELCSLFVVNRVAALHHRAAQRAISCAAAYGGECILSPEIGLALPAAFLYDHASASMHMLVAPKLLPHEAESVHVRISPPDGDGVTSTRTILFNRSVEVEYLDGKTKHLVRKTMEGNDAFCVQLLRHAFEPACWGALDL